MRPPSAPCSTACRTTATCSMAAREAGAPNRLASTGSDGLRTDGTRRGSHGYNVEVGHRTTMGSAQAKATARRGEWTINVRATVVFAAVFVLMAALLAFLQRRPRSEEWPRVHGTIQDTRIVADHALQTYWGGQVIWRAEYKVAYSVATREYSVLADSGVRGQSEADVRLALPQKPEVSVADCR